MLVLSSPIALAAFLYYRGHPAWALAVATGGLLLGVMALNKLTRSFEPFIKYGRTFPSKNITGRQGSGGGGKMGNVVVMAHYDTKSQPFPVEVRIFIYLLSGIGIFGGGVGVFILGLLDILGVGAGGGGAIFALSIFTVAISALLLFNSFANSPRCITVPSAVSSMMFLSKAFFITSKIGKPSLNLPTAVL